MACLRLHDEPTANVDASHFLGTPVKGDASAVKGTTDPVSLQDWAGTEGCPPRRGCYNGGHSCQQHCDEGRCTHTGLGVDCIVCCICAGISRCSKAEKEGRKKRPNCALKVNNCSSKVSGTSLRVPSIKLRYKRCRYVYSEMPGSRKPACSADRKRLPQ